MKYVVIALVAMLIATSAFASDKLFYCPQSIKCLHSEKDKTFQCTPVQKGLYKKWPANFDRGLNAPDIGVYTFNTATGEVNITDGKTKGLIVCQYGDSVNAPRMISEKPLYNVERKKHFLSWHCDIGGTNLCTCIATNAKDCVFYSSQ